MSKRIYLVSSEQGKTVANGIPLPAWDDAAAITSYITSILLAATTVITLVHPGFTVPAAVPEIVPPVAAAIAGIVQIVNIITHRGAIKAAVAAVASGKVHTISVSK